MKYKGMLDYGHRRWTELHAEGDDAREAMAIMLSELDAVSLGIGPDDHCTLRVDGETASFYLEDIPMLTRAAGSGRHELDDREFRVADAIDAVAQGSAGPTIQERIENLEQMIKAEEEADDESKVSIKYATESIYGVKPGERTGLVDQAIRNIVHDEVKVHINMDPDALEVLRRQQGMMDQVMRKIALDTVDKIQKKGPISFPQIDVSDHIDDHLSVQESFKFRHAVHDALERKVRRFA